MAVNAVGVGSGLNLRAMVNSIVEAERAPKQEQIVKNMNDVETNISAYGRLKTSLDVMKNIMYESRRNHTFAARKTVSSDQQVVSASASPLAVSGVYSIDVQQLAQSHKLVSTGFDPKTDFGEGRLSITLAGRNTTIEIKKQNSSLLDIVRDINSDPSNIGLQASVINDDSGARLILGSDKTGEKNHISVTVNAALDSPLQQLGYSPNSLNVMNEMQAAEDARILIDGLASVSSATNTFDDAIRGLDMQVTAVTSPENAPISITVSQDRQKVRETLTSFVDAFNTFYQVTKSLSAYDSQTQQGGPLLGDSVIRSAINQMASLFSTPIKGAPDTLKTLSELGISTTLDGQLEINSSILNRQLTQNFSALEGFFGGNDGFAWQMEELIQGFTGAGGAIGNRETSLSEQRIALQDEQGKLDLRMEGLEKRTMSQFSAMDSSMAEMNSQLSAMMSMMPAR